MSRLGVGLLGRVELRRQAGDTLPLPAGKVEALLGYLAFRPGHPQSRDHLAALLWEDIPARQARQRLRHSLLDLRRALGHAHRPRSASRAAPSCSIPATWTSTSPPSSAWSVKGGPAALDRAVALYRGELLQGLRVQEAAFEEWLLTERERLRELGVDALGRLLAHQLTAGPPEGSRPRSGCWASTSPRSPCTAR